MKNFLVAAAALIATFAFAQDKKENRKTVIVFPPTASAPVPHGLSLVVHEAAQTALAPTHNVLHARQLFAMMARHRTKLSELSDPNNARAAAQRLGAHTFVFSTLQESPTGWILNTWVSRVGAAKTDNSVVTLPRAAAAMVHQAAGAMVDAALKFDGKPAHKPELLAPFQTNDDAMREFALCAATLLKQPIGIENPTVLLEKELSTATAQCERAVKADPKLTPAWAALALATAIAGNDARSVEALAKAPAQLPNATLARFWLVSRYQSAEAAEKLLTETVNKSPGFMLARAYLAELYNTLGRHADAAKAWEGYAERTSPNPFAISKLAYTLARLGKADASVDYAEKALAYDSASVELNLELASRYLDANKVDKAIATLEPLAKPADATADVVLRLGYAKQLKGEAGAAETLLTRAHGLATDPAQWRTRGRAKLNLAQLSLKKGNKDKAKQLTLEAMKEGVRPKASGDTKDLMALMTPDDLKAVDSAAPGVKESSPFGLSGGEVNTGGKRSAAPAGFDAVKVQ